MAFVDDYQRLRTALVQKKQTSEQITSFTQALNNVLSELEDQQRDDHNKLDEPLLELYLNEAGEPPDYTNLSSLGQLILPFLAVRLQAAVGNEPCNFMTQLRGTGVIRGDEWDFLTSDFAENLFTYIDLPLELRRTLFQRLQKMTQTIMGPHIDKLGNNLADELGKRRPGERLLTLAHLHGLGRLKNLSQKERKILRLLITTNDPLVKELMTEWGLRGSRFDWRALQTRLSYYFSRRSLRAIRLVLGKQFLLAVVTLLWGILVLTTYFQWQTMLDLKQNVVNQNATDMQQILTKLDKQHNELTK